MQGRPVAVVPAAVGDVPHDANVLFIGRAAMRDARALVAEARSDHVLVVTEAPSGLAAGATLNFVEQDGRVRFEAAGGSPRRRSAPELAPARRGHARRGGPAMKRLTLRTRLARAALATTLAALLLNAALVLAYEFDRYREARSNDLQTQAAILQQSIAPALVFDDPESAEQQLKPLSQKREVTTAAVFRANGTLFARYAASPDDHTATVANPMPGTGVRFSGGTLELSHDVVHDGELVGRVYMRASYDLARRLESYAAIEVIVIALSMGLAIFLFGRLQKSITGPVARIAEVAQEVVQRREWGLRAPTSDSRDIGTLVDAFNRSLQEMETTTLELHREMAEREHAQDELRRADRRKDEFLATLAHELRNPLAPMMNSISLLRHDGARGVRAESIAILDRQLRHVVRLIDDLLDVSRISTGKLSLHKEDVDLLSVLRSALELIEPPPSTTSIVGAVIGRQRISRESGQQTFVPVLPSVESFAAVNNPSPPSNPRQPLDGAPQRTAASVPRPLPPRIKSAEPTKVRTMSARPKLRR